MVLSNKILAPHLLRLYVWNVLDNNTSMVKVSGKNGVSLVPVIPVSDEPDLADSAKTYIIYGFVENESSLSPHHEGTLSLRIKAETFAELGEIIAVIKQAFEIKDEAAANINAWSSTSANLVGIRFTSVSTAYVESGDAEVTEGGPIEGLINLRYRYVREGAQLALFDREAGAWA